MLAATWTAASEMLPKARSRWPRLASHPSLPATRIGQGPCMDCVCLYCTCCPQSPRLARLTSTLLSTNSSPQVQSAAARRQQPALAHCIAYLRRHRFPCRFPFLSFAAFCPLPVLGTKATPPARDMSSGSAKRTSPSPSIRNSHIIALPLAKSPGLHDQSWPHRLVPIFFESRLLMQSNWKICKAGKEQTLGRKQERKDEEQGEEERR